MKGESPNSLWIVRRKPQRRVRVVGIKFIVTNRASALLLALYGLHAQAVEIAGPGTVPIPYPHITGSDSETVEIELLGICPPGIEAESSREIPLESISFTFEEISFQHPVVLEPGGYMRVEQDLADGGVGLSVPVLLTFMGRIGGGPCGALAAIAIYDATTGETRTRIGDPQVFGVGLGPYSATGARQGLQDAFLNHVRKTKTPISGAVTEALEVSLLATCKAAPQDEDSTSLVPFDEPSITIEVEIQAPDSLASQVTDVTLRDGDSATVITEFRNFGSGKRIALIKGYTVTPNGGSCSVSVSERVYDSNTGETRSHNQWTRPSNPRITFSPDGTSW
jgi:hypothetical protein